PLLGTLRPELDRLGLGRVVVSAPDDGTPAVAPPALAFEALLAASNEPPAECSPDEVAFWLYSSGSTGAPKGVRHVHSSLRAPAAPGPGPGSDRPRLSISAGEPLPEHTGRRWRESVGSDILDGLGSTEMLHIFLSNRPDDIRYGTTGKPVPGYDVRILDAGGEVAPGEPGELVVRGPSAAEGYWNQRDKSRHAFRGEWTHTGDTYTSDANGYYRYCGRSDD